MLSLNRLTSAHRPLFHLPHRTTQNHPPLGFALSLSALIPHVSLFQAKRLCLAGSIAQSRLSATLLLFWMPLCFGKKNPEGNSAHDQSPVTPLMIVFPAQPWTEFAFLATTPH